MHSTQVIEDLQAQVEYLKQALTDAVSKRTQLQEGMEDICNELVIVQQQRAEYAEKLRSLSARRV